MNKFKKSSSLRVIIKNSFFRLTATVSITFAIVSIGLIIFTEYKLFIPHLGHEFKLMIQINSMRDGSFKKEYENSIFYRVDDNHMDILPAYLKRLDVGGHEVFHNNKAYYVLVKEDSRFRYLFEINQSDFERMERIIIIIIIIAMLLSWVVAIITGRVLSKKIINPIQQLSNRIKNIELNNSEVADSQYSEDEIGQLARLFDEYNKRINAFLSREKLFTSDVSHELRTPLMVINSSCEILLTQQDKNSKQYQHLLKIKSASAEMKSLLSTFLALARNDGDNVKSRDVQSILKQQYQKFLPLAEQKNLNLKLIINSNSEQLYPEEFLTIIIRNLLINAIKYTESGNIKIKLNNNSLSVSDTGTGIPEDIKDRVFDPFVRSQTNLMDGMGLGLSIVQRICEKKGWKIHLQSSVEKGTCIIILFT